MKLLKVGLLMSGITAILFAAGCGGVQAVPTPIPVVEEVTPTDTPATTNTPEPTSILVPTPTPTAALTPTRYPTATPTIVPTATPTIVPTATPTPVPTATRQALVLHYLNVWIKPGDDFEGGTYLLNPLGLGEDENAYIRDMTVSVIILPEAGWELDNWAGPVFNEEGNTAQVKMISSVTVVATMRRTDTK